MFDEEKLNDFILDEIEDDDQERIVLLTDDFRKTKYRKTSKKQLNIEKPKKSQSKIQEIDLKKKENKNQNLF